MSSVALTGARVRPGDVIEWTMPEGLKSATVQTLRMVAGLWVIRVKIGDGHDHGIVTASGELIQVDIPAAGIAAARVIAGQSTGSVQKEANLIATALLALLGGAADVA